MSVIVSAQKTSARNSSSRIAQRMLDAADLRQKFEISVYASAYFKAGSLSSCSAEEWAGQQTERLVAYFSTRSPFRHHLPV
jgi:hypothetical protein